MVLSWNERTGALEYSKVQQTFTRKAPEIYKVRYADGTVVETTWSHPFYIAGKGWVKGKDLRPGMKSPTAKAIGEFNKQLATNSGTRLPMTMVSFSANSDETRGKKSQNGFPSVDARGFTSVESAKAFSTATVQISESLPGAVEIVSVEVFERSETVYNFSVEEKHNYFVSERDVLVHNQNYPLSSLVDPGSAFAQATIRCGADEDCKRKAAEDYAKNIEKPAEIGAATNAIVVAGICVALCGPASTTVGQWFGSTTIGSGILGFLGLGGVGTTAYVRRIQNQAQQLNVGKNIAVPELTTTQAAKINKVREITHHAISHNNLTGELVDPGHIKSYQQSITGLTNAVISLNNSLMNRGLSDQARLVMEQHRDLALQVIRQLNHIVEQAK